MGDGGTTDVAVNNADSGRRGGMGGLTNEGRMQTKGEKEKETVQRGEEEDGGGVSRNYLLGRPNSKWINFNRFDVMDLFLI